MKTLMQSFTPRERTIAECLMSGIGPARIGAELGLTKHSVKQMLKRMYVKAGIRGGIQHVRLAVRLTYEREPELVVTFVGPFS